MIETQQSFGATPSVDVRRGSSSQAASTLSERPRAFSSFLTWPFFLAQYLALERLLSETVRPALADEASAQSKKLAPSESNDGIETVVADRASLDREDLEDPQVALEPQAEPMSALPGASSPKVLLPPDGDNDLEAIARASASGGGGGGGGRGGVSASGRAKTTSSSTDDDDAASGREDEAILNGSTGRDVLVGGGDFLAGGIGSAIGPAGGAIDIASPVIESMAPTLIATTNIVTGVVGYAGDIAVPVLESVPPSLIATKNIVTGVAGGALETANPVLDSVESAVAATAEITMSLFGDTLDIAASVVESVAPTLIAATTVATVVIGGVLETASPVLDSVESATAATAEIALGLIGDTIDVGDAVAEPITAAAVAAAEIVDDTIGIAKPVIESISPTFAATVDIAHDLIDVVTPPIVAPTIAAISHPPGDDLFQDGRHTDLGIHGLVLPAVTGHPDSSGAGAGRGGSLVSDALPESSSDAERGQDGDRADAHGDDVLPPIPALLGAGSLSALDDLGLRTSDGLI